MAAAPEAKFTEEHVLWVKQHTPKLITFAISRPESYRFSAGQFSRLGFRDGEGFIWRAYSVVSAEYADTLEYFAVLIEDGPMSAKFAEMKAGDTILLDKTATGFLLPERFPDGKDLVMLCTGSGIAPFLSILEQPEIWQRFERLALVHSVSYPQELIFNQRLADLKDHPLIGEYLDKFRFIPVTTRAETEGALSMKRIPELLANGSLAAHLGCTFNQADTRFMICGNPAMVKDTFQTLLDLGFTMHRNRLPGQIMMENGF
ncbi:ferredoxin--NADP reductase [Neisseria animalis]|uniref:ferredoxin--NADP(+) reductase n=1 Tax=Neisseria animalis TaxID=492 RepID=A0A5P3MQT5_NEIAN|nr:ferredoxin--NADP reductase [Neisseria animalis]QEY23161.1 ferredoxin--NADP reductase [Neisseria animalis]ROW32492.1 ferredoxin--NADP reductase [Neisseria animalis]VEE08271.1 putative ferredoxin--NADP reductase [Neisseria animalis]